MKSINNSLSVFYLAILSSLLFFTACNKQLEVPTGAAPITPPIYPSGKGIAATLAANPSYSFYSALITRAGLTNALNDSTKTYTLFATDNPGMKLFVYAASGGLVPLNAPDAVFLGFISTSLPAASAAGIVQYNTVGQKFTSTSFGTTFPNYPLTTQIVLDPTQPFVRLNIFPDFGTPYSYVNNLPVTAADATASNGVIHTTYSIVAPPQATLKTMVAADTALVYFRAAVARADSGSTGLGKLDSLMGYGVTNMTVLAPNNAALRLVLSSTLYQALYPIVYNNVYNQAYAAAIAGGATPAQATAIATAQATALTPSLDSAQANNLSSPAALASPSAGFNLLPVSTIKGIIAYHFLASNSTGAYIPNIRVFSNNFAAGPSFVKTLVNSSVAQHPGIAVNATFTGPAVSNLTFTGLGTFPSGGQPFTGFPASVVKGDNHAVNGVYHVINGVLLPQ